MPAYSSTSNLNVGPAYSSMSNLNIGDYERRTGLSPPDTYTLAVVHRKFLRNFRLHVSLIHTQEMVQQKCIKNLAVFFFTTHWNLLGPKKNKHWWILLANKLSPRSEARHSHNKRNYYLITTKKRKAPIVWSLYSIGNLQMQQSTSPSTLVL
jgi:hypothetical protein